jgi:hypothetical protein
VEERGARQRRAAAQALHRQRGYSMLGQEHCRRQADQATAGEQDWSFPIDRRCNAGHRAHPPLARLFQGRFYVGTGRVNMNREAGFRMSFTTGRSDWT